MDQLCRWTEHGAGDESLLDGGAAGARRRGAAIPSTRRLAGVAVAVAGLVAVAVQVVVAAPATGVELAVPPGYRVDHRGEVAPGVEHYRLVRAKPPLVVHVARVAPNAAVRLRPVLSNDRVGGPPPLMERTSEMCRRVRCVVAVNGDFGFVETGHPVGGLVAGGRLVRSPSPLHHQVSIDADGRLSSQALGWSGQLMPSDLRPVALTGVNVDRVDNALVLYTPDYGSSTGANPFGAELTVRVVEPGTQLRLGHTALVELTELRDGQGNAAIPDGGAVLSGHGTSAVALRDLWSRVEAGTASSRALLRLDGGAAVESLGGGPILLRDGRRWVAEEPSAFVAGRHPRTAVGWNPAGEVLLVTVDGRQPGYSVGLSLLETAELLAGLGATEAVNLDGGGSTTFVVGNEVVNQPSDRLVRRSGSDKVVHVARPGEAVVGRLERPVSTALAVTPLHRVEVRRVDPLAGSTARLPVTPGVPLAIGADPGSDPRAGAPALLGAVAPPAPADPRLVALATAANVGVAMAAARRVRRRPALAPSRHRP